jgi:hypothetical protein
MNALSFAAFGLGEWQARLWTACAACGVLLSGYAGPACSARVWAFTPRWCSVPACSG